MNTQNNQMSQQSYATQQPQQPQQAHVAQQQQDPIIGSTLERPSQFNNRDGFLNGMVWDRNHRSALFFFTTSRKQNNETIYTEFAVKFWEEEAQFLESLFDIQSRKEAETGGKFPLLVNFDARTSSYRRPTGKKQADGVHDETINMVSFDGRKPKLMVPQTYQVWAVPKAKVQQAPQPILAL